MSYEIWDGDDMGYGNDEYKDYLFTAIKMATRMDYKAIKELRGASVISCHRDLTEFDRFRNPEKLGLSGVTTQKLVNMVSLENEVKKLCDTYMDIASRHDIHTVTVCDEDYPMNWRELSGMPEVCFIRGRRELLLRMTRQGSVAAVGSRDASKYSLFATEQFCSELSKKGVVIVSGMALGIDRQAHMSSVHEKGGTVAVLAGGPDQVYPPANKDLYEQIIDNGLVVSEMPPGQAVLRQYFPARNRLIAGLGDCVMIMEAGEVSGTLHTASFAASQGKEVFVLPNSIYFENAKGGLKLLQDGCHVLAETDDVIDSVSQALIYRRLDNPELMTLTNPADNRHLDVLAARQKAYSAPEEMSDSEWQLIISDELSVMPHNVDELCLALSLPFYRISQLLVDMQLSGTLELTGGKYQLAM